MRTMGWMNYYNPRAELRYSTELSRERAPQIINLIDQTDLRLEEALLIRKRIRFTYVRMYIAINTNNSQLNYYRKHHPSLAISPDPFLKSVIKYIYLTTFFKAEPMLLTKFTEL